MRNQTTYKTKIKILKKAMCFILTCILMSTMFGGQLTASALTVDPPISIIALFPYGEAPYGWMKCDGRSLLRIQNNALYSLLLNKFGGDANNFNLPNLTSPIVGVDYYIATSGIYGADYVIDNVPPIIGEVCLFPDGVVPTLSTVWKLCNGSELSINTYPSLFTCIGTTYGGNGVTTFGIPNLNNANPLPNLKYYIAVDGQYPGQDNETLMGSIDFYAFSVEREGIELSALPCDGRYVQASYNRALADLIGTKFGGSSSQFKLPNFRFITPLPQMQYAIRTMGMFPSFD